MQSENINELAAALSKVQAALRPIQTDKAAEIQHRSGGKHSYRYASLEALWNGIRAPLAENGLCVVQKLVPLERGAALSTLLAHKSGQWIDSTAPLPQAGTSKEFGGFVSAYRRYELAAMIGIAIEEDDGQGKSRRRPQQQSGDDEDRRRQQAAPQSDTGGGRGENHSSHPRTPQQRPGPPPVQPPRATAAAAPAPPPVENPKGQVTQKQLAELLAAKEKGGWPDELLRRYIAHKFSKSNERELTAGEWADTITYVRAHPHAPPGKAPP